MSVNHMTSFLVETMDALNAAEIMSQLTDSILYVPDIATVGAYITHYLPRTVWSVVEMIVGFDSKYNIDIV